MNIAAKWLAAVTLGLGLATGAALAQPNTWAQLSNQNAAN